MCKINYQLKIIKNNKYIKNIFLKKWCIFQSIKKIYSIIQVLPLHPWDQETKIFGNRGSPALLLISTTKLLKNYLKNQMVYTIKLNLVVDKPSSKNEPKWLFNYDDIFPKELTQLPLKWELDHAIDLIP